MRTLVWFRNDLRVDDNPALHHAMEHGEAIAAFCFCNAQWRDHDVGDNRLAFLLDNLHALAADLRELGVPLRTITEPWFDDLPDRLLNLAERVDADGISFNEEYPLNERVRDSKVTRAFEGAGRTVTVHHAGTVQPPGTVLTGEDEPYTVFTPFKKRWLSQIDNSHTAPLPRPDPQTRPDIDDSDLPEQTDGVPRDRVAQRWPAGAAEARRRLDDFADERIVRYHDDRDFPAVDGTSSLSPYLSVGSLSARQCLATAVENNGGKLSGGKEGIRTWIDELIWRDFYRHVIAQFPHVSRRQAFRREYDRVPWRNAPDELEAWKEGRTGYPLVDAAMRQLAKTGWMHNRLRMVTAMFLTKHLLIDWRQGERHFMEQLVDGDFAANNGGWQWSASTGTDAAPYFRIFNPHTQAKRFDPKGEFIRRMVPELAEAPDKAVFDPEGNATEGYPRPIVAHKHARQRALDTFKAAQSG
ncbi:MAG: deoxyribodipyrimidine photo-lyase [Pseudomonadales bacterium]